MATLLTVTGRTIDLVPESTYVLGRGDDCELQVEDLSCSRRHARITVGKRADAVYIEDLGSRNGTFVSEERVYDRTIIGDGARIRVGTTLYLLQTGDQQADGGSDGPEIDTATVTIERLSLGAEVDPKVLQVIKKAKPRDTEFAGQLGSLSLVDVLQLLMQTNRSGTLHVEFGGGAAHIELREGEVFAAWHDDLYGFQALLLLVRQKTGLFWLIETDEPCRRNVHEPASILLVELCRAMDEENS